MNTTALPMGEVYPLTDPSKPSDFEMPSLRHGTAWIQSCSTGTEALLDREGSRNEQTWNVQALVALEHLLPVFPTMSSIQQESPSSIRAMQHSHPCPQARKQVERESPWGNQLPSDSSTPLGNSLSSSAQLEQTHRLQVTPQPPLWVPLPHCVSKVNSKGL